MARRSTNIAVQAGPATTDLFKATELGGEDGDGAREILVSCSDAAENPMDYRVEDPADPPGEWATLKPGDVIPLRGEGMVGTIKHVIARGNGGATIGGIEVIHGKV